MSKYPPADAKTQWFQDNFPGATMNLTPATTVLCLHTTEGGSWPTYGGGSMAPTYTAMPRIARKVLDWRQHFPDEKSARALENHPGGVETNTLNCVQVELVGTCDPTHKTAWPGVGKAGVDYIFWPDAPDWLLRELAKFVAYLHTEHGLAYKTLKFNPYPSSITANRMTGAQWSKFIGICGHQHVPENVHGDPGDLAVDKLIAFAKAITDPSPFRRKPQRGGTWNVKTGRSVANVEAAVLDLFETEQLDWLNLCEVSTVIKGLASSKKLANAGIRVLAYPSRDIPSRETAILVRKKRKGGPGARFKRLHGITAKQWERDPSNKGLGLHPGRKSVSAKIGWLHDLAVHTPPGPFGPSFPLRKAANLDAFAHHTAIAKRWSRKRWVAPGDWNRHVDDPVVQKMVSDAGAQIVGDGIDWVLASKRVKITNPRRVDPHGSDHRPFLFTVEAV